MAKRRTNPFNKLTGKPITKKRAPAKRTSQNMSLYNYDSMTTNELQLLHDDYEESYLAGMSMSHHMPQPQRAFDDDKEIDYLYNEYLKTLKPAAKKASPKKTSTPKKKSSAKPAAKKTSTTKKVRAYQTGRSNLKMDEKRKAKLPGKRKSASGRIYYERRKNRSDTESERKAFSKRK